MLLLFVLLLFVLLLSFEPMFSIKTIKDGLYRALVSLKGKVGDEGTEVTGHHSLLWFNAIGLKGVWIAVATAAVVIVATGLDWVG